MHSCTESQAVCRGCGKHLRGSPYYKSGMAYHPEPGGKVFACYYGGWVCSRRCDIKACVELEGDMPGCSTVNSYSRLSREAKSLIESHWPEES